MADRTIKLLAVSGSYRRGSWNTLVLSVAAGGAEAAGADVEFLDLNDYALPMYHPDLAAFDSEALRLQDKFAEFDGYLISTPEYNGSVPGGFKNAIDWLSRGNEKYPLYGAVRGKPAAIMSASPGQFGGIRCLPHLRSILSMMQVTVLPAEIAVPFVDQKFDSDGAMTDDKMRMVLTAHGAALAATLASSAVR